MNHPKLSVIDRRFYGLQHRMAMLCLLVSIFGGFGLAKTWASSPAAKADKKTVEHKSKAGDRLPLRVRRLAEKAHHDRSMSQVTVERDRHRLADAYQRGIEDGRLSSQLSIQAQLGRSTYHTAMQEGHAAFVKGAYGVAVRQFILASELDQGDPAARLFSCHARTALGHFDDAAISLRRAFELESRLAYLPLDIRNTYANPKELARHISALHLATVEKATDARLWFLLGYYYFYTGSMSDAAVALDRAKHLAPNDRVIDQLAEVARQSVQVGVAAKSPNHSDFQSNRPLSASRSVKPKHSHQHANKHRLSQTR